MESSVEMEYRSKNHSKFLLKFHIIFVCKYRNKVLAYNRIDEDMKQVMFDISNESDFRIEVMETDKDHLHMMVSSPPKLSPLSIVRRLKQESTIRIWRMHEETLHRIYWRERTFWTDGYFVSSVGNVSQETIKHYIENQG